MPDDGSKQVIVYRFSLGLYWSIVSTNVGWIFGWGNCAIR